jgi:hypothetical protein
MRALLIILLFTTTFSVAKEKDMNYLRETFYKAIEDEKYVDELEQYIVSRYSDKSEFYPPVILAYTGGIEALKAKHVFSPFSKLSHVLNSLDILEEAVKRDSDDLEIRFIRYSILDNIPSFFGYKNERNSDKKVIIAELLRRDYSSLNEETQKGISEFMIDSSFLTSEEKTILADHFSLVYNE